MELGRLILFLKGFGTFVFLEYSSFELCVSVSRGRLKADLPRCWGEILVCLLPGNETISEVCNLFMFLSPHFCLSGRFKAAFPGALSLSQRGRPNLILRSSNIPQSNITRLRSYNIQRERAILFHHSSPLSVFQSSTNVGLFCLLPPKASLSYRTE